MTEPAKKAPNEAALGAAVKDEERREKAKQDLTRLLQSYVNKLNRARDRDAVTESKCFCKYARENYASRAEPYFEAMLGESPESLFDEGDHTQLRPLSGLPTVGDVFELVRSIRVRRPNHWPDPNDYSSADSKQYRKLIRELTIGDYVSFKRLLEEPWETLFRQQIGECIRTCVRDARLEYELRFPTSASEADINPLGAGAKKRGRPPAFPDGMKTEAIALKASGNTNKQVAAFLYGVRLPTDQQVRSVSTILRYHKKKSQ